MAAGANKFFPHCVMGPTHFVPTSPETKSALQEILAGVSHVTIQMQIAFSKNKDRNEGEAKVDTKSEGHFGN